MEAVHDGERLLRPRDGGPEVRRLQEGLLAAAYPLPRFGADGDFGAETQAAVEALQRDAGFDDVDVDGVVDAATLRHLDWRLTNQVQPQVEPDDRPSLEVVFDMYRGACECGEQLGNNCAHYLSDAFIRAGYTELDGGDGALFRNRNGFNVCKAGRPVRARELRQWFDRLADTRVDGETVDDGYWAVFQQSPGGYWGGHVLIHRHSGDQYDVAGTGDFPGWAIQEHYTW